MRLLVSTEGCFGHELHNSREDECSKALVTCWHASHSIDCGCHDNIEWKTKAMDESSSTKSVCVAKATYEGTLGDGFQRGIQQISDSD